MRAIWLAIAALADLGPVLDDPGVVHEDVEPAVLGDDHVVDGGVDGGASSATSNTRLRPRPPWPPRSRPAPAFDVVDHDDGRRRPASRAAMAAPEPRTRTGHQRNPSVHRGDRRTAGDAGQTVIADRPRAWTSTTSRPSRRRRPTAILTIPNVISFVRLLLHPAVPLAAVRRGRPGRRPPACSPCLGATDWVDGYIARHFDQVSTLGKVLDPTADRLLLVVGVVAIIIDGSVPAVDRRARRSSGRRSSRSPPSCSPPWAPAASTSRGAGKAGTFGLMFAYPAVPRRPRRRVGWARHRRGPGLVLRHPRPGRSATSPPPGTSRSARRALARGPGRVGPREGRDHGRRRGHPPAAADLEPAQADDAAGQPADDGAHRRSCCSEHGFDEIVVTVAFLANTHPHLLRRRLRVRRAHGLRHRGDAARHGRLGAQRHGRARRALPRHLRRRAHRHRPVGDRRRSTRSAGALATIGLTAVENPLEFGIVITNEDGSIERFLEKPTLGPGVQRHRQHRHLRARAGDLRLHPRRPVGRLLRRGLPAAARRRASRSTATSCEGYWEDVGTLEAYVQAHQDVLDGKVDVDVPGFRLDDGRVARRGRRDRPRRPRRGPGRHRRQLPGRGRRPPRRRTPCSAPTSWCSADADLERDGRPRQRLPRRRACGCGARSSAGRATCARGVRCEEGVVLGDECFVGEHAVHQPRP